MGWPLNLQDPRERWKSELEQPGAGFFAAFAARIRAQEGTRDATLEAIEMLVPAADWSGCLPHVPHGLLGTWAAWALRPRLTPRSFERLLATQLHGFAHENRHARNALRRIGPGSGSWANIEAAVRSRRPAIAWGECQGIAAPTTADFHRVADLAAPDMANMGHKPVTAWALAGLFDLLGAPPGAGRLLLGYSAWFAATEPVDVFWHQRAGARLGPQAPRIPSGPARAEDAHSGGVRELCDLGLVELLDRWCARLRQATASGDLLSMLARAAAEKQLDARRDLEGKTAWNWVFLAALTAGLGRDGGQAAFAQAAALVNLFPTDEEEDRIRPKAPPSQAEVPSLALVEAVLDAEVPEAMFLADFALRVEGLDAALDALAEAASRNDPSFNHSHQALAVASASILMPHLSGQAKAETLQSLAKFLANSQGSSDLGRLADRALETPR